LALAKPKENKVEENYAGGTVRHKDGESWKVTSPREQMYSTALMLATEFWDSKTSTWKPIFPPESSEVQEFSNDLLSVKYTPSGRKEP